MSVFGDGFTIPVPSESPVEGHEEETAVNPEEQEFEDQDFDNEEEFEEELDPEEENPEEEEEADPDETGNSDELLAGKYKSVHDLVNGYLNLQREFTKSRQPQQQQPAQQIPAPTGGAQEQSALFMQQFSQNPLGTLQYLIDNAVKAQTAPIIESRQTDVLSKNINELANEYKQVRSDEGMKQLFGKVAEIAEELGNPQLAKNPTARVLRMAAVEAFGDTKQTLYQKAKQKGRKEAEEARAAKKGLPAARAGAKSKVNTEQPLSPEDEIRQGILAAGRGGKGLLG